MSDSTTTPVQDPSAHAPGESVRVDAVVGVVAYCCTVAAVRYAKDADAAPTMAGRAGLLDIAAARVQAYRAVVECASRWGVDAQAQAGAYLGLVDDAEGRLRPADWLERLLKSYLTIGLLADFCAAVSQDLPEDISLALDRAAGGDAYPAFVTATLRRALDGDAQMAARLGLWGRRVVGEDIGLLMGVAGGVPGLAGGPGRREDIHGVLSDGAVSRMQGLGLRV